MVNETEAKGRMTMPKGDEHIILQEQCGEDNGHKGTLTLTDTHLTFETESGKSEEKMIEFSAELKSVQNVWIEGGLLRKRLAVEVASRDNPDAPETIEKRKFHVSRPVEWETKIKSAQQRLPRTTTTTTTTTTKQVTE